MATYIRSRAKRSKNKLLGLKEIVYGVCRMRLTRHLLRRLRKEEVIVLYCHCLSYISKREKLYCTEEREGKTQIQWVFDSVSLFTRKWFD